MTHWPHPFFIHHQTPNRKNIATLMLVSNASTTIPV